MSARRVIIAGIGAFSPVGFCAAQTAASVRAGISRFAEVEIDPRRDAPVRLSMINDEFLERIDATLTGPCPSHRQRLLRLAAPALREAVSELPDVDEVPVFLGVAENDELKSAAGQKKLLEQLQTQTRIRFDLKRSAVLPQGRAAGLQAIGAGVSWLRVAGAGRVLVGGVDSFVDPDILQSLSADQRILEEDATDGFIPGEGAAFLLLELDKSEPGASPSPRIAIDHVHTGVESGHLGSSLPYRGEGLCQAMNSLREQTTESDLAVASVVSGFNGEGYLAKEWGIAALRHRSLFREDAVQMHPADCLGDVGAALGALMSVVAFEGLRKRYLESPALLWCASDGPARAVARFGVCKT